MNRNTLYSMWLAVVALAFPGCSNTPTGLAGPGGGTLSGNVLDSDADGFSDDLEINSTPGTDPFDATDNPNNVRDTDGDGCSDYDELNFDGFCDGDPNTPAGVTCNTAYYNSDFRFGFDLPTTAILESQGSDPTLFAFDADWSVSVSDASVTFFAWVVELPESQASVDPDVALAEWADVIRDGTEVNHDIVSDFDFTLANGDTGHVLVAVRTDIPVSSYQVFTVKDNMVFTAFATTVQPVSLFIDFFITDVVFSLCVD